MLRPMLRPLSSPPSRCRLAPLPSSGGSREVRSSSGSVTRLRCDKPHHARRPGEGCWARPPQCVLGKAPRDTREGRLVLSDGGGRRNWVRCPNAPGRGLDLMLATRGRRTARCFRTFSRPASLSSSNGDRQYFGRRGWISYPLALAEGGALVEVVLCARLDGG